MEFQDGISKERYLAIGRAVLIYALLFGVCLYKNASGILTILIAAATVFLLGYCAKTTGYGARAKEKKLYPYYIGILLLGISMCCTADSLIITVNYIGSILLVLCALLRIYCEEKGWGLEKYAWSLVELILSPLTYLVRPFQDYHEYRRSGERKKSDTVKYIVIGVVVAIPFILVVLALLASADAVFSSMLDSVCAVIGYDVFTIVWRAIKFFLFVLFIFLYVYGVYVRITSGLMDEPEKEGKGYVAVVGITFTGLLTFIYLIFSGVQILYLFSNSLALPEGYTYSQYAREGFFQLLAVAAINLLIVLFCMRHFKKSRVLDIVLTMMSACTYIMLASSAVRMILYIKQYGLTYLRIEVLVGLLLIATIMAGVVVAIYRKSFPLAHYIILVVGVIWILFSFSRPEYIIAKYNISQYTVIGHDADGTEILSVGYDDLQYLASLEGDAAPAIYELAEDIAMEKIKLSCWSEKEVEDMYAFYFEGVHAWEEKPGIRSFNFSRYKAYKCGQRINTLYERE